MKINLEIDNCHYYAELSQGKSIAIALLPNGEQPNHFGAPACTSDVLVSGDFVGDTKKGGSCNVNQLSIIPHCNGTHTESVSHIVNQLIAVDKAIDDSFFPTVLVSVEPESAELVEEKYIPGLDKDNKVITRITLEKQLTNYSNGQLEGLVIRIIPNEKSKKNRNYDENNYPPFLTNSAMDYLVERKIKHLMVDFPSVDKMFDQGNLSNHRLFWGIELASNEINPNSIINKTITEMVFVDDEISDGFYLCNLKAPKIETDAVPSDPELYKLVLLDN